MKRLFGGAGSIRIGVAVLSVCLLSGRGLAAVVFEAGFNGRFSGIGGAYDLTTAGGTLTLDSGVSGQVTSKFSKDNPMAGGGGYFSCVMISTNFTLLNTVTFKPGSATNSLDAMTSVAGGDRVLNGGFDFFFRANKDISNAQVRALDSDNRGKGGLRFTFGTLASGPTSGLRLEMIANTGGLLSGGEGGGASANLNVLGAFPMASNTVYHLGLTFATDAGGTVTAKLWGQAGTGAIDLTTATPVATLTFGINESVVTNGFQTGDFVFNQLRPENILTAMTQEYDHFRIYNATPTSFGALSDYAWRDSAPQTVLQADFRGNGNGTGGRSDLVALGGTGALIDYGAASDASVISTAPFRDRSSGYLSILSTTNLPSAVFGRAAITPASAASSLAAMSVVTNGQRLLRGGLDFFFRTDHSITNYNEFRPIDTDNKSAGGLRLILHSDPGTTMMMEMIANADGLYTGKEGGALATSFSPAFPVQLVSNTVYHVGLSFDGAEDGTVTAAFWLKEGTGAIELRKEMPVYVLTFGINEAVVTNGLTAGTFDFGKLRNDGYFPTRQDYDALRIYSDTPVTFSALPVPPPGTMLSLN